MLTTFLVAALAVIGFITVFSGLAVGYLISMVNTLIQVNQQLLTASQAMVEKLAFMDRYLVQVGTMVGTSVDDDEGANDPTVAELIKKIKDIDSKRSQPSNSDDVQKLEQLFQERVDEEEDVPEEDEPDEPWKV